MKKLMGIVLTSVFLVSCSASRSKSRATSYSSLSGYSQKGDLTESAEQTGEQEAEKQQRIIIYNASISIVLKNPDSTNVRLSEIASIYEGYVQTLGSKRSVIRVKADKLNNAVTDISGLGKVKSKIISGNDVTDQYTDFQVRLENAYKARDRYLELLARAENVEAALKVENELERLNREIDLFEGKLKRFTHLSDYSTITVHMEERVKPGILGYIGIGLYKSVKWLFVRN